MSDVYDLMGRPYPGKKREEENENPCPKCGYELYEDDSDKSTWYCYDCQKTFYKTEDNEFISEDEYDPS